MPVPSQARGFAKLIRYSAKRKYLELISIFRFGDLIFVVDIVFLFILLIGICWSVGFLGNRIWPPPSNHSWQYYLSWILFYLVFVLNTLLIFTAWNSWYFEELKRFILGTKNTSGSASRFINTGPCRYTRNPQYLGDIILFIRISILANSLYLWITHFLLILVFLITPLTEEDWLNEQYGELYQDYLIKTSRFL